MTAKTKGTPKPNWVDEWIGARRDVPVALLSDEDDPDAPPHLVVWLEADNPEPVALVAIDPEEPLDAALVILEAAMREPSHGSPRMPRRLRVDDPKLAAFLAKHVDPAITIETGDTPEVDALLEALVAEAAGDDE